MTYSLTLLLTAISASIVSLSLLADIWSFLKLLITIEFLNMLVMVLMTTTLMGGELTSLLTFMLILICEALVGLTLLVYLSYLTPYKMSFCLLPK